jgi:hypothetical protein
MIARRSNQRVLPPCAPGPLVLVPRAAHAPSGALTAAIICGRLGCPRGPP